ncbi:MAG TPA: PASTA domain-containing protein [Gaiellaceae bacterium]|nr:PASTA domain-containing protein [Gaiellaceae bacterium]
MTVLRAFLVVCVLVVVGASADASASSTAAGTWTLSITFAGTGTGLVTTIPAGILCTNENPDTPAGTVPQPLGTCSAQFPVGVAPWVIATPSGGSRGSLFGGISNCVGEKGSCQAGQDPTGATSVQVMFNTRPIPCVVERVIGQPLAQAKRHLRFIGCRVGTVRYAYSSTNLNFGEVISQNPTRLWQRPHGAVNLVVSKGKRGT